MGATSPGLAALTDLCQRMHKAADAENWVLLTELIGQQSATLNSRTRFSATDRPQLEQALAELEGAIAAAIERKEQIATLLRGLSSPTAPG